MNYQAIYDRLISRAKSRQLTGYTETHHVVPRCLNGEDSIDNLVKLTPEEHYLAHQLLLKIHPNSYKLAYAANMMTVGLGEFRSKNKRFGWLRRKLSETQKGMVFTEERCRNISNALRGRSTGPRSEETKRKLSEAKRGVPKTEEHKKKLSVANTGKKASEESRRKMSESRRGVPKSPQHNLAVAESKRGTKKIEVSPGVFRMLKPEQLVQPNLSPVKV